MREPLFNQLIDYLGLLLRLYNCLLPFRLCILLYNLNNYFFFLTYIQFDRGV